MGNERNKDCIAFLAGKEAFETDNFHPDWIGLSCTKNKLIWEDGKERLVYVLKFQKPRYSLFLLNKYNCDNWLFKLNISDLEKNGIKIITVEDNNESIYNSLDKSDLDYEILIIDDSLNSNIQKYSELPLRKIFNNIDEIKALLAMEKGLNGLNIFLKAYKFWIKTLEDQLDCGNLVYSIFFDDKDIANKWDKAFEEYMEFRFLHEALMGTLTNVNIWRHRELNEIVDKKDSRGLGLYYYQYATYNETFFSFIFNIDIDKNKFLAELVLNQVKEMALMDVLIIDERLAKTLFGKAKLLDKIYWMGIDIVPSLKILKNEIKSFIDRNERSDRNFIMKIDYEKDILSASILKNGEENKIDWYQTGSGTKKTPKYYILLIHQTRFNEILKIIRNENCNYNKDSLARDLKKIFPIVIIHSGRGKPSSIEIPGSIPYVEYSTIERYLISEPSKFYLIQTLLSSKDYNYSRIGEIKNE